jgi:divalent metal cation (Fe/Co/Zn/Cd) transporter
MYNGFTGHIPELNVDMDLYLILGVGILLKFALWIYCLEVYKRNKSDTLGALAEDHFNDVLSNSAAIVTAAIAFNTTGWWVDPVGAILISVVIIFRWVDIIREQTRKIVGHTAPPEFIEEVSFGFFCFLFFVFGF